LKLPSHGYCGVAGYGAEVHTARAVGFSHAKTRLATGGEKAAISHAKIHHRLFFISGWLAGLHLYLKIHTFAAAA